MNLNRRVAITTSKGGLGSQPPQLLVQVDPVREEPGRAVLVRDELMAHLVKLFEGSSVGPEAPPHHHELGPDRVQPPGKERARRVGRNMDRGAGLVGKRGTLVHMHLVARPPQSDGGGEPGDAAPDYDDFQAHLQFVIDGWLTTRGRLDLVQYRRVSNI